MELSGLGAIPASENASHCCFLKNSIASRRDCSPLEPWSPLTATASASIPFCRATSAVRGAAIAKYFLRVFPVIDGDKLLAAYYTHGIGMAESVHARLAGMQEASFICVYGSDEGGVGVHQIFAFQ